MISDKKAVISQTALLVFIVLITALSPETTSFMIFCFGFTTAIWFVTLVGIIIRRRGRG